MLKDKSDKKFKFEDFKMFMGLWPYIKPYSGLLIFSVVLIFIIIGVDLTLPYLTKKAIDGFIITENLIPHTDILGFRIESYPLLALIFVSAIIFIFLIDFFQSIFMEYTGQKIILNLRTGMFKHMVSLPVSFYDQNTSGRLVSRVTNDIENMNEMFSSVLVFVFHDVILMASIVGIMFFYDVKFTLVTIVVVPFVVVLVLVFSKMSRYAFGVIRETIAEINHSFSESISGIKVIHTSGNIEDVRAKFNTANQENFKAGMLVIKVFGTFMPVIEFLNLVCLCIIILYGGVRVMDGEITIGVLVAFISYMKMFFRPVRDLSEKFNQMQNAFASSERIIKILNESREKFDENSNLSGPDSIDEIEFANINFEYKKDEPVLKNLSFKLKKGESLGIAGHTGAGKSSIINLLSGFYTYESGSILINKNDYKSYKIENIRKKTALVMQDPILFAGTIRENLLPGGLKRDDDSLKKALMDANCDFLFNGKNNGLDTIVREGGRPFSSGEKQLICIARAFAFDPELIIFDEATSFIDSESEFKVHTAMKNLMKNRTSILIAHRLSTIREADKIILIKKGEVIESGNHEDLMKIKGEYYSLVQHETLGLKKFEDSNEKDRLKP